MFAFPGCPRAAHLPSPSAKVMAHGAALALLLIAVSGCSSTKSYNVAAAAPARVSAEMEDDGIPVQSHPPMRIRAVADDPSEPFSRNYGGPNPSTASFATPQGTAAAAAAPAAPQPPLPDDLPAAFRQELIAALNDD